uniref:Uncharacterized protein n=1 Tax=Zea mays TaxID=4577 RepID=A0A804RNR8_MAIZE
MGAGDAHNRPYAERLLLVRRSARAVGPLSPAAGGQSPGALAPPAAVVGADAGGRVRAAGRAPHIARCPVSKVNSLWPMEQCRQGKSAKRIRNFGKRIGSEGWARGSRPRTRRLLAEMLELLAAARAGRRVPAGGRTGNGPLGGLPRASNNRLRTESKLATGASAQPPAPDPVRAFAPQGPVPLAQPAPADAPRRAASKLPSQRAAC